MRLALAFAGIGLAAATTPAALSSIPGGLWEVTGAGAEPVRLCVADPVTLAQFEHRDLSCKRDVVRNTGTGATIHYTCTGGGFGHSSVKVITPRSLRVETQGISSNAPFKYVLQARRVGNCPGH